MDRNFKSVYFVIVCALVVLVSITFNGTYAFYTASLDNAGNDVTTTTTTKSLTDMVLSGDTKVSVTDLIPGESVENTFRVQNDNNLPVTYTIYWTGVTNTFVNTADLILSLEYVEGETTNTLINESDNKAFPTANNEVLASSITIPANTTQEFTVRVLYKNTESNQVGDSGKSFGGTIQIRS